MHLESFRRKDSQFERASTPGYAKWGSRMNGSWRQYITPLSTSGKPPLKIMLSTTIDQELVDYVYENFSNVPKSTEYEKMISSMPYDYSKQELMYHRLHSTELAADFGKIRLSDYDNDIEAHQAARHEYLSKIFGKIHKTAYLEPPFFVDYGCNIELGKNFYGNFNLTFLDCTVIKIGDSVLVGPNVCFTTATHPVDPTARANAVEYAKPIFVGNNVWIGAGVTVLPGVTIGDNAVVGAGSVVTRDVPANTVVVGIPAKVVKQLDPVQDKK